MTRILVLHGPNINLTGRREAEIYGTVTLDEIDQILHKHAEVRGIEMRTLQSNHEGVLVDALQECRDWADGVIFNPGALSHYSFSLRDAVAAIDIPVIEVHMSQIAARESFRHTSVIAPACAGQIAGFGLFSYVLGIDGMFHLLDSAR